MARLVVVSPPMKSATPTAPSFPTTGFPPTRRPPARTAARRSNGREIDVAQAGRRISYSTFPSGSPPAQVRKQALTLRRWQGVQDLILMWSGFGIRTVGHTCESRPKRVRWRTVPVLAAFVAPHLRCVRYRTDGRQDRWDKKAGVGARLPAVSRGGMALLGLAQSFFFFSKHK